MNPNDLEEKLREMESWIAEANHRIALLVRLSRLNLLDMPDSRIKRYMDEFQDLTRTVEKENPPPPDPPEKIVPLAGPVSENPGFVPFPHSAN